MVQRISDNLGGNHVPQQEVAEFCERHHIRKLAFFGSVLRDDFGPASDVDLLVEFQAGKEVGLIRLGALQRELSALFGGRAVDMRTKEDLSRYIRDRVIRESEVLYERE